MSQRVVTDITELLRPRTPEEREAGLHALVLAQQHAEARMAERGGRPYTPSTLELLEEARGQDHCDERTFTALA
jgi:hypothetical protein